MQIYAAFSTIKASRKTTEIRLFSSSVQESSTIRKFFKAYYSIKSQLQLLMIFCLDSRFG